MDREYFLDARLAKSQPASATPPSRARRISYAAPLAADDERLCAVERVVARVTETFGPDASFADVGCGTGRYLERLNAVHPADLRLTGIDPSSQLLRHVPCSAVSLTGNLLRLPAGDNSFAGACCVEALEQTLVPERAVAELCRALRPAGRSRRRDR